MNKYFRIKKNIEFNEIIKKGKRVGNNFFNIYYCTNSYDHYRFGIAVTKKLGNAVERNKYKRQIRFLIDKYKKNYQKNLDCIIMIRNDYINSSFNEKEEKFEKLIKKIYTNEEK